MAQRGQTRREDETEEQRNRGLSDMAQCGQERKAEETEEKEIADCQAWHNVARRDEQKKTDEQTNGRLVRQDVSRELKE
ncbi:hypothetical protein AVEN_134145-1 [Araneus ventricosus]|uniref:Uncharacterized protein n=1 Tax=Araneus ventricosus TaxID=182803 RepID=A0A4Y2JEZ3_ARAVE|nr:hypothetical protein AVEN_134145-1 [Araneus ventricosus]